MDGRRSDAPVIFLCGRPLFSPFSPSLWVAKDLYICILAMSET
jgi:hypothetical protein